PGHVLAQHVHAAGGGGGKAQDDADRGGLARPVGAEEAVDAAAGDRQIDVVHGELTPEALGQAVAADGEVAHCSARESRCSGVTAPASTRPSSVRSTDIRAEESIRPPST